MSEFSPVYIAAFMLAISSGVSIGRILSALVVIVANAGDEYAHRVLTRRLAYLAVTLGGLSFLWGRIQ